MKWKKLGKIFDPANHNLTFGGAGFAQSPQALVLNDRVRVYFSTRERDETGKFISHVAFVDFDKRMRQVLGLSSSAVMPRGDLGCFDEHGIFPFSVLKDGNRILAYTTGWSRRVSVSADAAIGLAVSHDNGISFERYGNGPVMAAILQEPFLIGDAFVLKAQGLYHMWYIFGLRWARESAHEPPDRVYKIAHAISGDGIRWERESKPIIADRLNKNECQALPTVFFLNNVYHMYFCYRQFDGFRTDPTRGYRIGYAYSQDMKTWVRDDSLAGIQIGDKGWDAEMQCYPHVFECEGRIYMLYNGNEFGRHGFGLAELMTEEIL